MAILRPEALPAEARRLAVALPSPYVYRSPLKRAAARILDGAGYFLKPRSIEKPDWSRVASVAVLRLDHLGDLLHSLPALRRLRRALPQARLELWVGPWGTELASLFADVDQAHTAQADWFRRPQRVEWPWGQIEALGQALKAQAYDAAIELRGDLRHHLALWQSRIPLRVGQALTAGGFLLTHAARWDSSLHEQEQNLSLLDQAGLPAAAPGKAPYLKLPVAAQAQATALLKRLKAGSKPVMVQAACGTEAKRWPPAAWAALLHALPKQKRVILLGSASERAEMQALARGLKRPVGLATGELGLAGLAAFLAKAGLLISVDSGPAHLAAVQGVPVLSLFSGTNRAAQWAPRGPKVKVLQALGFPCAPCELSACPYGNACMNALDPALVLKEALAMLKA